jgi:hypothetical protein
VVRLVVSLLSLSSLLTAHSHHCQGMTSTTVTPSTMPMGSTASMATVFDMHFLQIIICSQLDIRFLRHCAVVVATSRLPSTFPLEVDPYPQENHLQKTPLSGGTVSLNPLWAPNHLPLFLVCFDDLAPLSSKSMQESRGPRELLRPKSQVGGIGITIWRICQRSFSSSEPVPSCIPSR